MSQLITVQLLKDLIATVMHLGIKWQMGKEPREMHRGAAQILAVLWSVPPFPALLLGSEFRTLSPK